MKGKKNEMNALYNKITKKQKSIIKKGVEEEFQRQSNDMTRRIFKLFCVSLNEEFQFGKERLERLLERIENISEGRKDDPVFWAHIDRAVKNIGLNFIEEDYEKMDD
jgi:hypothetical protein